MQAAHMKMHPENPDARKIREAANLLSKGEVIIIPTDTIYAVACKLSNKKGIAKICKLLGKKPTKANLSLLCKDLSHISMYTKSFSNVVFKLMKHVLPGPYTFILDASNQIPKLFGTNKKTVGIRVPDNEIVQNLVDVLGEPLVSSSIHSEDEILDYLTDPNEIYEEWKYKVAAVLDGGAGGNVGSTVIDCTGQEPVLVREGAGYENLEDQLY